MRLSRPQIQPIGLDIGTDSIKMMQVQVQASAQNPNHFELKVVAAARQSLPEEARKHPEKRPELVAALIRKMLAQQPFVGRRVVAALPRDVVHVKNLRLPSLPEAELAAAVQTEARNLFSFDTDQARIQFLQAGEVRQGNQSRQELIVLAVKTSDVDQFVQQLDHSGVIAESLDTEMTGIFRTFERFGRRQNDQEDVQMLIDIGAHQTQALICKGRDISFYKPIGIGGLHLLDAVGRKLGITNNEAKALRQRLLEVRQGNEPVRQDPVQRAVFDATRSVAEELARELALCLRYYSVAFRGHRPQRIRIVGGEAADPQLHAIFKSILSIPVEAARPLFSVDTTNMRASDRQGAMAPWALAMGLSLRFTTQYFAAKDGKPRATKLKLAQETAKAPFAALPAVETVTEILPTVEVAVA